ncbi:MAG TPA: PQQ-binding-like beta-propeller repeat protein, partial [Chitinophagaceae bacterium]|nr:PQQ-binding-like beta-propeller repeat protein [Chitinophagaceae bacterium]
AELAMAKKILDSLNIPYFIIPGNHDTGWSESGGLSFTKTFGYDKFYFKYNGIHFLGCPSGPYVRMSDGHVPRDAMNWLAATLKKIGKNEPVVFLNHYPLDNGLDNWYEVIDLLKQKNTILALCGHGHNNRPVKAEDIPAVMGRSNLRAKAEVGGYNVVNFEKDSILFRERNPVTKNEKLWTSIAVKKQTYPNTTEYPRPQFAINDQYKNVKAAWTFRSDANVISTPAVINDLVVFGNQAGLVQALKLNDGSKAWSYKTGGPIFSSPAVSNNSIVIASTDGYIYCLDGKGKELWKVGTDAAVLGSPIIEKNTVYIGGSDHSFRAVDVQTGKVIWSYDSLKGPVTSKPVTYKDLIIFGAWDRNLYALNKEDGKLLWKWNNGSSVINYSPAACIPVVYNNIVYVAAPDRYLSAIDATTGKILWRTAESAVRESIGISEDSTLIFGKTMNDTIVAFRTNHEKPTAAWKYNAGYGYEHTPSALYEKKGHLFFGTRNGVVYAMDTKKKEIIWAYKIDNSMVNTVNVLNERTVIAATMDGKVCLLQSGN